MRHHAKRISRYPDRGDALTWGRWAWGGRIWASGSRQGRKRVGLWLRRTHTRTIDVPPGSPNPHGMVSPPNRSPPSPPRRQDSKYRCNRFWSCVGVGPERASFNKIVVVLFEQVNILQQAADSLQHSLSTTPDPSVALLACARQASSLHRLGVLAKEDMASGDATSKACFGSLVVYASFDKAVSAIKKDGAPSAPRGW